MTESEIASLVVSLAMESGSFNEQISQINRDMKVVESEFKSAGYTARTFGDNLDGLNTNLKRCESMLELQGKAVSMYEQRLENTKSALDRNVKAHVELEGKISSIKEELNKVKQNFGENSEEADKLQKELNKLSAELEKNEELIRNSQKALNNSTVTYNNAVAKMKSYEKQIKDTKNAIDNFNVESEEMGSVNVKSTRSISEMTIAMGNLAAEMTERVVEAFGELIQYAFEYTEQMTKFTYQTGFSIESLQQWDAILQMTGGNIDQLAGSLADFQERIYDATQGVGDGAEVFTALEVEVTNLDGSLRSTEDVFNDTIFALQNMENETLKNSYATMLLSTGGEELARALGMTNDQLSALKGNINVLTGDEVKEIQELNDQWTMLKQELSVEFMRVLATYSDEWAESLKLVGDALLGIMQIINNASDFFKKVKSITDWIPSNVVFRTLATGAAKVGEMFSKSEEEVEQSNINMQDNIKDTAEVSKDAMGEVADSVSESMQGMESSVEKSLGVINSALDEYYDDERRKHEKSLEEQYGDSKKSKVKIGLLMDEYDKKMEQEKQKDMQRYSKLYIGDAENYGKSEEDKTKKLIEESNKRISQYRKEQQASKNAYGKSESSGYSNGIESYDTGTQYHKGGLAYVHKDELIDLSPGAKVYTKSQSQEILRNSVTNNNDNKQGINIQNMTVQSNTPEDWLRWMEDMSRLK